MSEEQSPEKFSDDPEEQLRIENELLRLKLQAETGADYQQLSDVPPDIEHMFLNNILAFERQLDHVLEVSVAALLGNPTDILPEEQLNSDEALHDALSDLEQRLMHKGIDVDFQGTYPDRVKYKFISEELMAQTIQQFDIPGMIYHFSYEEFHPNHEVSIKALTDDFMNMWFSRNLEATMFVLGPVLTGQDGKDYYRDTVCKRIKEIFEAYIAFDQCTFSIETTTFELDDETLKGKGMVKGTVQYQAMLETSEALEVAEAFNLTVAYDEEKYWEVIGFKMPGLSL